MLKKRRKGLIASGILALSLAVAMFSPFSASAVTYYTHTNNAKMIGGVGSYGNHLRYYWIDSGVIEPYKSYIIQARDQWVRTSSILITSIDLGRTTTRSGAVFEFYYEFLYGPGAMVYAETNYFYESSDANPIKHPTRDYKWARVTIDYTTFSSLSANKNGVNEQKSVIAHEFGHCFGLAHCPDENRLMHANSKKVDRATYEDLRTINYLYG